ncbi:CRTAC1 family protein [Armatimonas rosea]|uniref:ASPIC/UnbV domain-containing protein n=1 Tax=Armatimonas rosea TaxID=685828 RepID=A0A7W9SQB1_ARMRO|nr:CRTAC1 family protein [Armatimonas rosea]MBB6050244.1 hypothetical protein [Armatimonas rosea]
MAVASVRACRTSLPLAFLTLALSGCHPSAPSSESPKPPEAPVRFQEVVGALDFKAELPGTRPLNALQTIGSGCAFLDANADGNLDVLLIAETPQLFLGEGTGKFTRVALLPHLSARFIGCAVGDYDGDGYDDLYLSAYRGGVLLHNETGKGFKDVTAGSGLAAQPFGTACVWVESVKGSGKLDLLVANYARFGADQGQPLLCDAKSSDGKPIQTSCPPRQYPPLPAVLFRNDGKGHFRAEPTPTTGRGLGAAAADPEGTGQQQLALANDEIEGDLLQREGEKLVNHAPDAGVHTDRDGNVHGGMGADWGDYDNDGKLDLVVATFNNEPKSLYHNEGKGLFTDQAQAAGTSLALLPYVSFGVKFFDADNDGFLDLLFANGHVQDNIAQIDPSQSYRQPTVFLHNDSGTRFTDLSKAVSAALTKPLVGRGLAVGDYDNDGRVDVLIGDIEGTPLLLHNESPQKSWIGFVLEGSKSNRNGYGARVTVTAGGKTYVRHCHTDGSYLSASDKRVHVGLGAATTVEKISILWPSGVTQTVTGAALNRYNPVKETP